MSVKRIIFQLIQHNIFRNSKNIPNFESVVKIKHFRNSREHL